MELARCDGAAAALSRATLPAFGQVRLPSPKCATSLQRYSIGCKSTNLHRGRQTPTPMLYRLCRWRLSWRPCCASERPRSMFRCYLALLRQLLRPLRPLHLARRWHVPAGRVKAGLLVLEPDGCGALTKVALTDVPAHKHVAQPHRLMYACLRDCRECVGNRRFHMSCNCRLEFQKRSLAPADGLCSVITLCNIMEFSCPWL